MFQSKNKKILHIDMDAFFVSVEEVLDPSLKGKLVIVGGRSKDRGVVTAVSYPARKYGVRSAMPITYAKRLCPNAVFLESNPKAYAEFSKRIFKILCDWSPCVEPVSIDEAYVDLTGCERLYGPVLTSAQHIRDRIKDEVGISSSVGVASNKLIAKIACGYCKPNGMLWIPEGMEKKFLTPMSIHRIPGIGLKTGDKLWKMGIKTVGQLADFPRELLEKIFGRHGTEFHERAQGRCNSLVERREKARSISRETTFETNSSDPRFLLSALSYLTEKVAGQLRDIGLHARRVTLKLRCADFKTITRSRTLSEVSQSDHVFYRTASELFWKTFNRRIRVRLIGLELTSLTTDSSIQRDLFTDISCQQRNDLYQGIDRIRQKYGFKSILYGLSRTWLGLK